MYLLLSTFSFFCIDPKFIWYIILAWRTYFNISYSEGLLAINMLSFGVSGKVFILPSFMKNSFSEYKILHWHYLISAL